MGKHKKRKRQDDHQPKPHLPIVAPAAATASTLTKLTAQDVATTISTLNHLAANPELLASKALRELRAALHPIVEAQLKKYDPIDYVARVTTAFRNGHGADALLALQGLHARGQSARQGTVQRWVRDCDSIADVGLRTRLLHAVLRAGKPLEERGGEEDEDEGRGAASAEACLAKDDEEEEDDDEDDEVEADEAAAGATAPPPPPDTSSVVQLSPFVLPPSTAPASPAITIDRDALGLDIVLTEAGPERQPPNHHDLHIYTLPYRLLDTASAESAHAATPPERLNVPQVPGAFVLTDVLSAAECARITAVAEAIGYTPDHPLSRPAASGIGGLEILMSTTTMAAIFARCESVLPPTLGGGKLAGINARCRFFKYTDAEKAVYRPHIDGSWPGSGLDPSSGAYVHDAFGDRRSRLTFLIYLNDGFDGGCTTFYLPRVSATGAPEQLCARGVVPRAGSVLCFPQGNTASLLHEGSAVTRGCKYVIRTDVLYAFNRGSGPDRAR